MNYGMDRHKSLVRVLCLLQLQQMYYLNFRSH
jgi:hypothetical protein